MKIKIAINTSFGGFSVNEKVAYYLKNNKNWNLFKTDKIEIPRELMDEVEKENFKTMILVSQGSRNLVFFPNVTDAFEFRTNPDLLEAIETVGDPESATKVVTYDLTLELNDVDGNENDPSLKLREIYD